MCSELENVITSKVSQKLGPFLVENYGANTRSRDVVLFHNENIHPTESHNSINPARSKLRRKF